MDSARGVSMIERDKLVNQLLILHIMDLLRKGLIVEAYLKLQSFLDIHVKDLGK